ncbi:hypothetical protein VNO77_08472 [Canavalia gladiata]|uniref:Uncharacterized protein n=1 Tax=Canavalia gladiata TaxID=3824 RepID=A0AAN9QWM1_CANGL
MCLSWLKERLILLIDSVAYWTLDSPMFLVHPRPYPIYGTVISEEGWGKRILREMRLRHKQIYYTRMEAMGFSAASSAGLGHTLVQGVFDTIGIMEVNAPYTRLRVYGPCDEYKQPVIVFFCHMFIASIQTCS